MLFGICAKNDKSNFELVYEVSVDHRSDQYKEHRDTLRGSFGDHAMSNTLHFEFGSMIARYDCDLVFYILR